MRRVALPFLAAALAADSAHAFVASPSIGPVAHPGRLARSPACPPLRMADTWKRIGRLAKDKFDNSRDWVDQGANTNTNSNLRGVAGGAVIGGLVAGPFGALVGGWLGQGAGLSKKAEEEELARVGLTREDAMAMRELVMDLQGLEDSLASLRQTAAEVGERVRSLGEQAEALHAQARECLEQDNEDGARKKLEERQRVLQLLSSAEEQEIEVAGRLRPLELAMDQTKDALQRTQEYNLNGSLALVGKHAAGSQLPGRG